MANLAVRLGGGGRGVRRPDQPGSYGRALRCGRTASSSSNGKRTIAGHVQVGVAQCHLVRRQLVVHHRGASSDTPQGTTASEAGNDLCLLRGEPKGGSGRSELIGGLTKND